MLPESHLATCGQELIFGFTQTQLRHSVASSRVAIGSKHVRSVGDPGSSFASHFTFQPVYKELFGWLRYPPADG